ncbi:unnamed protein product [Rotaria sp. Silwood2]|nr:unnamed protein product [Rotaria sp. Silwood2]
MTYQTFQYKGRAYNIPISNIDGECFVLLEQVQDHIHSSIRSFTHNGLPVLFEFDEKGTRLRPNRIRALPSDVFHCHKRTAPKKINNDSIQMIQEIHRNTQTILENTEILKSKADAILRQTFELTEFTVPRLFIVLPEETTSYNPINWFHHHYRLYFICECENEHERHLAFHDGYEIKQPREFLRKYGPHLRQMLTLVKYALTIGSFVIPQITSLNQNMPVSAASRDRFMWENFKLQIEQMNKALEIVEQSVNFSTDRVFQHLQGAELREIEYFLNRVDNRQTLGNLYRSTTNDGHVRWVLNIRECILDSKHSFFTQQIKQLAIDNPFLEILHDNN